MISIKYSRIPPFLRDGAFFVSLNDDEQDSEINIPSQCYAENDTVNDSDDFARLLRVTAFWGLNRIPQSLIAFCDENEVGLWQTLLETECAELPFAQTLRSIFTLHRESGQPLVAAIRSGVTEIVEYLAAKYIDGMEATSAAAELGRLDYLQFLHKYGHKWERYVCDNAVRGGHLACLQYLHTNGCPWVNYLYITAAVFGQFDCLKYACEQGLPWHPETAQNLAENGRVEMLQYAVQRGCSLDEMAVSAAANYGHSECLQYLLEVGCPADDNLLFFAAEQGHVACLQILHQHRLRHQIQMSWDREITAVAANEGHLDCLTYLHENGCPWDEGTTACAASYGHLNTLRYAIEHNCPCWEDILRYPIYSDSAGDLDCLRYLIEVRGFPLSLHGAEFLEAFTHANLGVMQYLIDRGCVYLSCKLSEQNFSDKLKSISYSTNRCNAYDAKLLQCIECAVAHNWDIAVNGVEFCSFVQSRTHILPLCAAYLTANEL